MKLNQYLSINKLTHADFAKKIGCRQPTITRYLSGRVPTPEIMSLIVKATNGAVTPSDFYDIPG